MALGAPSNGREVGDRLTDLEALTESALIQQDIEALLGELLSRIRTILDADTAAVLLLDPGADELVARAAHGIEEEVRQGVRVPVGVGFAGRIASTRGAIRLDRVDETTVDNPLLWEKGIQVMLGVPLISGDDLIGVLHVGRLERRPFDDRELELLQVVAERVVGALMFRQLADERAAATVLERSLLPAMLPRVPGIELAARYVAAEDRSVGGDWYDVFRTPSDELWLVVGDVAGHGLRAAVVMGRVRSALRAYTLLGIAPERVLELVDRKVQHFEIGTIATVAVAVSKPPYALFHVALAGHPPPVVATANGADLAVVRPGPPLGTIPGLRRQSTTVALDPGDVFVLYTDGLVERRGETLDVGLSQLQALVATTTADAVARSVMHGLVGARAPADDIALLVARRTAPDRADERSGPEPARPAAVRTDAPGNLVEQDFANSTIAPTDVRALVRTTLESWHLTAYADIAALLADELAGNAVRHACTPLTVRVARSAGSLRIAVDDHSRTPPMLVSPGTEGAGGRGILLVDALSARWGFEIRDRGKSVWFELAEDPAAPIVPAHGV